MPSSRTSISQQYVNLIHSQPLGDWTLGANLGFFYGKDDGSARAGDLDNKTWSGLFSAKYGGNTFYVGLQKLTGNNAWMRVNGTSGGTLANDSYNSSYDNAQEKSWQVRHDYNFAALGVPGPDVDEPLHQRQQRAHRHHHRRQGMGPRKRIGLHRAKRQPEKPDGALAQFQHAPRLQQQRV